MKDMKKAVETNGFKFVTMAVKIGSDGKNDLITRIANDLGGKP